MATKAKTGRKPNKLTASEIKLVRGIIEGKTQVQAAQDAYPNQGYAVAASTATEVLKKPKVQDMLAAAYKAAGITPQAIADVLSDAMLAKKSIQVDGKLEETTVADHAIRVNAARVAANLAGMGAKDSENPDKPAPVTFNIGTKNYIQSVPQQ